eukprot:scaffold62998_cov63-Phaeocystis_antarctica.AAC.3
MPSHSPPTMNCENWSSSSSEATSVSRKTSSADQAWATSAATRRRRCVAAWSGSSQSSASSSSHSSGTTRQTAKKKAWKKPSAAAGARELRVPGARVVAEQRARQAADAHGESVDARAAQDREGARAEQQGHRQLRALAQHARRTLGPRQAKAVAAQRQPRRQPRAAWSRHLLELGAAHRRRALGARCRDGGGGGAPLQREQHVRGREREHACREEAKHAKLWRHLERRLERQHTTAARRVRACVRGGGHVEVQVEGDGHHHEHVEVEERPLAQRVECAQQLLAAAGRQARGGGPPAGEHEQQLHVGPQP